MDNNKMQVFLLTKHLFLLQQFGFSFHYIHVD
jgi:hypothetical protein